MSGVIKPLQLSVQASYAIANTAGTVHHPIRYKPNTPHMFPSGLTPSQVKIAYGINTIAAQGEGQVIAIVDAFNDPNIEADLDVFSRAFGLPKCSTANGCFKKITASNKVPPTDGGWSGEIALDVEWAHAIAPKAHILLVEAASDSNVDLMDAVKLAIKNKATVVSMSWGGSEESSQTAYDKIFNNPKVSFTASSGDDGTGVIYPASSPYVLAVGGTTLDVDSMGNYQGERAWSGSGGGLSSLEAWHSSQRKLPIPRAHNMRGVPDVSYNADPETGFSVYDSVPGGIHRTGWQVVGGTSAGAPQWAAIIAITNSAGKSNIGNNLHWTLYAAANPKSGNYSAYFYDITSGTNGQCGYYCTAQEGYDYVTGLGSPQMANIINVLAK